MKKILLFLSFLLMSIGMFGQTTTTYTFNSKSWAATPANWISGGDGNQLTSNQGVQITAGTSGANATSPKSFTNISSIVVTYCTNASKGEGIIKVKVGDGVEKSFTVNKPSSGGTTLKTTTFNYTPMETGTVLLTVTCSVNSIYIYSISITENATDVDVTGVSIIDTLRLIKGNSETLTPTIIPSNATNKNVTWGSLNTSIASVSEGEVHAISEGTTKIWVKTEDDNKTDTCVVIVSHIPPAPSIDIAVWDTNAVYINIDNFEGLTAEIEGKTGKNIAEELFFSKYFEAQGGIKLLGIYNGTNDSINLNVYEIKVAQGTKVTTWGGNSPSNYIYNLSALGYIHSNEEIILISYTNANDDPDIIECILEKNPRGLDYQNVGKGELVHTLNNVGLQFSGDDAIGLFKNNSLIDIIGAGTTSSACIDSLTTVKNGTLYGHTHDDYCWITDSADSSGGYSSTIATNLCLLIRKNSVKSGANAVQKNTFDFVTLAEEWQGKLISKNITSTCNNFDTVGTYDYSSYYSSSVDLIEALQKDGTYKLEISQLDTLACNNIKIVAKDNSNNTVQETFKVPIMVSENKTSTQVLTKHGASCPTCDLVVMHNAILTVDNALSNRDVKVYAGSRLLINSDKTYTVNSLSLRKTDDTNSYLTLKGNISLAGDSSFYLDVYTDPSEWRWLALPDTFDIRNITLSNGKKVTFNVDYLIKTYSGYVRATQQKNGWVTVFPNKQFMPGEGFIFGIAGSGTIKKEFRFKFANNILTKEKANKTLRWNDLQSWGGGNSELRPNHKGWNLIGNAFLDLIDTELYDPIGIGKLVHSDTEPWDGKWEVDPESTGKLRYRVIHERNSAGEDGNGYSSELLDDVHLEPFSTFFIQLGGESQDHQEITLNTSKRRNMMRRMIMTEDEDDELFLRVFVGDKKTGMFISNKFTEDYEPGDDLESRQTIYQNIGGYRLLYSAIPDSTIEKGVLINAQSGKLFLDEKVNINNFEYIYVKYGNSWYNLLQGETVDIESGSFILQAKRKKDDIPTGFDLIPTKGIYKFTDGKYIYINRNGELINVLGNKIK